MSLPAIIDLRPSGLLLNPHFDGYKLSLDPVPVLKTELITSPWRVFTSDDQYSFLHAKLFSLHNHLFRDPWLSYSSYFIDEKWIIQNVRYDNSIGKLNAIKAVHKLSKPNVTNEKYNASIRFVSEKYCVFSDGCGSLKIFTTGDRYRYDEWKTIYSDTIFTDSIPFVIQDARWEIMNGIQQIHCLLLSVQRNEKTENEKYETFIDWVVIKKSDEATKWSQHHVRQMKGNAVPEYCQLEPKCNGLLLSADRKFEFTFDSENPIETPVIESNELKDSERLDDNSIDAKVYAWNQTDEDICIQFNISRDVDKSNIKVICDSIKLQVRCKDNLLLDSDLFQAVDNESTTWNLVFICNFLVKKRKLKIYFFVLFSRKMNCLR